LSLVSSSGLIPASPKKTIIKLSLYDDDMSAGMQQVNQDPEQRTARDKFLDVYNVARHIHLDNDTVDVNGNQFSPTAYFGTISAALNGNQLLQGDPGRGKTTSAEAISSLAYGMPLEVVQDAEIRGNAEATEEKIKGTLDLGELNQGNEVVQWNDTVMHKPIIIDEINRLTPGTQGTILDAVDRNNWTLKNETVRSPAGPFYATANRQDVGNTEMPLAVRDRYDIALEVNHPGQVNQEIIDEDGPDIFDEILDNPNVADEIREITEDKKYRRDPREAARKITDIAQDFRGEIEDELTELKQDGYEVLLPEPADHEQALQEISNVDLGDDASMYLKFLDKDLNLCGFADGKRCNEQCEYSDIPAHRIAQLGGRATTSIREYAKAAAWLDGSDTATIDHLEPIIPYALNHRSRFQSNPRTMAQDVKSQYDSDSRPVESNISAMIAGETRDRFEEKEEGLREAHNIYQQALYPENFEDPLDYQEAISELEDLAQQYDDGSDGFIRDYLRSLRSEVNNLNEGSDYGF
jgi:MoxR-like ATPase